MQRDAVKSSNVKSVGYDPEKKILEIEFLGTEEKPGGVYQYTGFTREDWGGFSQAVSIGTYFARNIRGKFPHTKMPPEQENNPDAAKKEAPTP